jgi:hypothetical protein
LARDPAACAALASQAIDSGAAAALLAKLIEISSQPTANPT